MKRVLLGLICAGILSALTGGVGSAIVAIDPDAPAPLANQPLIVTAVPFGSNTSFIEVHNPRDRAVNTKDFEFKLEYKDGTTMFIQMPDTYLLSESYMTLGNKMAVTNADAVFDISSQATPLSRISLVYPDKTEQLQLSIDTPTATRFTWLQRKTGESGLDTAQANMTQKEAPIVPRGLGTYALPSQIPFVRIVEILASPADCAPNDTSLVCSDYIKLYNPSDIAADISSFRLRTDSGTSVSGNAFKLPYIIPAKSYITIAARDDGDPLSLTNDGGYVWFEDAEGILRYDDTMIQYPDASSTTKTGWAWIVTDEGTWAWTSTPQPNAVNKMTQPAVATAVAGVTSELAECSAGKYRYPETNRCRNIEEAIATLTACEEGKERNPETNRCRSIATLASAALAPCDDDQERNPATNRCRKIANAESSLHPCDEGQERNPATNRCRNIASSASATTFADPLGKPADQPSLHWLGGAVLLGAAGYGIYEWRSEISRAFRRFIPTGK